MQRDGLSVIRQASIKLHQIGKRDTDTAQGHSQPRFATGQGRGCPRPSQCRHQAQGADLICQQHHRNVQRLAQGVGNLDFPPEMPVEILRGIGPKANGTVVNQRFGMGQTLIEGHRIHQRFQRRSRGPQRPRHIHETLPLSGRISPRSDRGQNIACRYFSRQNTNG